MKNVRGLLLGVLAGVALTIPALADPSPTPNAPEATSAAIATPDDAVLSAVRGRLASQPAATDERQRDDQTALTDFYTARHGEGLWVTASGLKPEAKLLASEIANAWAYALDVSAFKLPKLENGMLTTNDTDSLADAEIQYSTAALLYARHARGGRIPDPTSMLTRCSVVISSVEPPPTSSTSVPSPTGSPVATPRSVSSASSSPLSSRVVKP